MRDVQLLHQDSGLRLPQANQIGLSPGLLVRIRPDHTRLVDEKRPLSGFSATQWVCVQRKTMWRAWCVNENVPEPTMIGWKVVQYKEKA